MNNEGFNAGKVIRYLFWTFLIAYGMQFIIWRLYSANKTTAGQLVMAAMMFVPALGVILAGGSLRKMGWKPMLRDNVRTLLIAMLIPAAVVINGATLYYLAFPSHADLSGSYLQAVAGGSEILRQLAAEGMDYQSYVIACGIQAVTVAPFINMIPALGEEIGWRGFLYPQLKKRFGHFAGNILGGIIWGAWHWPLIILIGYEYGAAAGNNVSYIGFPYSGMAMFCLFTVTAGILHFWLYEKSGTIWIPALFHSGLNAVATLPLLVFKANTGSYRLLGPAINGFIAMIPLLLCGLVVLTVGPVLMVDKLNR
ncbi:MAG: CPBP family intramembrane metalloprotease [Erysipelotrichaceae bacterium]|nr:CPBP family intramembrane metalloprotease [Erysipelotrichaceae bacterium]